jgi:hypothetical protein
MYIALLDGIIADTCSSAVIGHNRGSRLGMAHLGKAGVDGARLAAVVVETCSFGFRGTGDDDVEDVADDRDLSVGKTFQGFVATLRRVGPR